MAREIHGKWLPHVGVINYKYMWLIDGDRMPEIDNNCAVKTEEDDASM